MSFVRIFFEHLTVAQNIEMCLRLVLAFIVGGVIGLERSNRFKEAGVRTHIIAHWCLTPLNLGSEKTMRRMTAYLHNAKPRSAEEIADEMLAIMSDRERWTKKKEAEEANAKYNELLYFGLGQDE